MKKALSLMVALGLAATLLSGRAHGGGQTGAEQIDGDQLKAMIEQLGHSAKRISREDAAPKYEFAIERGTLKVPIGAEVSPSKNYVWLTVYLGQAPANAESMGAKLMALMKANGKIQPAQFYLTENSRLMLALPLENRGLSNAAFRKGVEKVLGDVSTHQSTWTF